MKEWIKTDSKLPEEGKYVLGIHCRGTWHDSSDQEHVNMVIIKLEKGITQEEREKMKAGEIDDPEVGPYSCGYSSGMLKRSTVYEACDEEGNNKRPYNWSEFGPDSFFGQDITHWMELPSPPEDYITGKHKHVSILDRVRDMVSQITMKQ